MLNEREMCEDCNGFGDSTEFTQLKKDWEDKVYKKGLTERDIQVIESNSDFSSIFNGLIRELKKEKINELIKSSPLKAALKYACCFVFAKENNIPIDCKKCNGSGIHWV